MIIRRTDEEMLKYIRQSWKDRGWTVTPIKSFPMNRKLMYQFQLIHKKTNTGGRNANMV